MSLPISLYKKRRALEEKERSLKEENELIDMLDFEQMLIAEQDESWRRRQASRTPDEVARGICAPG
jgi:hypothetical protein